MTLPILSTNPDPKTFFSIILKLPFFTHFVPFQYVEIPTQPLWLSRLSCKQSHNSIFPRWHAWLIIAFKNNQLFARFKVNLSKKWLTSGKMIICLCVPLEISNKNDRSVGFKKKIFIFKLHPTDQQLLCAFSRVIRNTGIFYLALPMLSYRGCHA